MYFIMDGDGCCAHGKIEKKNMFKNTTMLEQSILVWIFADALSLTQDMRSHRFNNE